MNYDEIWYLILGRWFTVIFKNDKFSPKEKLRVRNCPVYKPCEVFECDYSSITGNGGKKNQQKRNYWNWIGEECLQITCKPIHWHSFNETEKIIVVTFRFYFLSNYSRTSWF